MTTPFSQTLRDERERQRFSMSNLGERAGVDHSLISRFESGDRVPGRESVRRLADTLELEGWRRTRLFLTAGFIEECDAQRIGRLLTNEVYWDLGELLESRELNHPTRCHMLLIIEENLKLWRRLLQL